MSKISKISYNSIEYPDVLKNIPSPPEKLYVLGDNLSNLLSMPRLSVVGSRKVSAYGRTTTEQLVKAVASKGVVIISGLALGVDSIAHNAALSVRGKTIAVLPCGLENIYPSSHFHLAKDILASGGALVSEYEGSTPALKEHFIARNRIVSGLGDGVLITEAAIKSGTLHTSNFALDQGKTVMAVPGNINSETSQGTNDLLKSGATLITEASDILFALGINESTSKQTTLLFGANKDESTILKLLSTGVTDGGELLQKSKMNASIFNQTLTMLELNGRIRSLGGGHWTLC